ncbi:MAG: hypothetical protein EOR22_06340 [Mesorhizobium sp.]|nr:MAG: hypothetical protein EOR22_06340 [Mesorhizobium sp.]
MDIESMFFHVNAARAAMRAGLPITASVHMRHALQCANALKSPRLRSRVFRIRNKLRPLAGHHTRIIAAQIAA